LLEKTLKSIEPTYIKPEKNSRFCIACGKPATKLVKYSTEGAIIVEKYCDKFAKAQGIKKIKIDELYKEGFLLAIRLVASELKTIIDKKMNNVGEFLEFISE
jgi:hypothetical protein